MLIKFLKQNKRVIPYNVCSVRDLTIYIYFFKKKTTKYY